MWSQFLVLLLSVTVVFGHKEIPKSEIKPRKKLNSLEEMNNFIDSESVSVIGAFDCVAGSIDKRDGLYHDFMDAADNHMDVAFGVVCDRDAVKSLNLAYIPGAVVTRGFGESSFPFGSENFKNGATGESTLLLL